ncbi:DUF6480 family protein [Streptomyces zagrosensis]|uniref:Uncharacterized protein n=1 Tax=Streptomyces zagrosensis TaxID=1042984 RepID=A0A7W9V0D7_9ACTN|nr:DUF6480 family protein [Streptomyces zagrosensis]MBB5937156.1 hypothetical protein [Streptomyces zagrosensis]
MDNKNPDPDPDRTTGLEPGGSVPPGETPPAEGSTPDAGPEETHNPTTGWAKAPVFIIGLLALAAVIYFIARIVLL